MRRKRSLPAVADGFPPHRRSRPEVLSRCQARNRSARHRKTASGYTQETTTVVFVSWAHNLFAEISGNVRIAQIAARGKLFSLRRRKTSLCAENFVHDEIDGKKVVDFDKTFWNNKIVVAIRVGNNVTEIKKMAFSNCENLKYVVLGESVKSLGSNSFANTNIKEIELNDGLQKIGEDDTNNTVDAPDSNYGMDLKIPDSVTEIHVRDFNLIVKSGSQAEQYAKDFADSNNLTYTVE